MSSNSAPQTSAVSSKALASLSRLTAPNPCTQGLGPTPCKVMLLGEAPGEMEQKLGIPFCGAAGKELDKMMHEAGLNPGAWYRTNVFKTRPLNNKLDTIFVPSADWKASFPGSTPSLPFKIDNKIHYLPPAFQTELDSLAEEIQTVAPNLIVALGATALWALSARQNISSMRGTILPSSTSLAQPSRKLLPTFHPAAVLRQWDLRPIVIADLMKAATQAEFPELRRPSRLITVNPSLRDLEDFYQELSTNTDWRTLAVDVETRNGQITEIGFAPSPSRALVVPFITGYNTHYWKEALCEAQALRYIKAILQHPIPKVFQNGLYDLQYIWKTWRFTPAACNEDTMLKHHSLFPEMQKGLAFLGSIYTEEPAWKFLRHAKETEGKRDDE